MLPTSFDAEQFQPALGLTYSEARKSVSPGPVSIQVTRPGRGCVGRGELRVVATRSDGHWVLAYEDYRRFDQREAPP